MPAVLRVELSPSNTGRTRSRMVWAVASFLARIETCTDNLFIVMPPTLAPANFCVGSDTVKTSIAGMGVLISRTPVYMLAAGTAAVSAAFAINASRNAFWIDSMLFHSCLFYSLFYSGCDYIRIFVLDFCCCRAHEWVCS